MELAPHPYRRFGRLYPELQTNRNEEWRHGEGDMNQDKNIRRDRVDRKHRNTGAENSLRVFRIEVSSGCKTGRAA
jgi:hypothetical protein